MSNNNILLNKISLEDFVTLGYAFNVVSANNAFMSNIRCTVSNSTSRNRSFLYNSIGGCLRTINIIFRKFENVEIINSFSDKTTYGLIIKDDPKILNEFSNLSNVLN